MQDLIVGLVVKWLISALSNAAAGMDWGTLKTKVHAAIAAAIPVAFIDAELDKIADSLLDTSSKLAQDQPDLITAITALASKNLPAAEAALKTALSGALTGDLAEMVAAA